MRRFVEVLSVLVVTALCESGCTLTSNVIGSEKRNVYKFDPQFAVESSSFRRSTEALGTALIGRNHASLLRNGDEIFLAMTKEIRQATKSVNLETYIFQPDEAGRMFADAMIDAAKKGVEVRLLIDAWGSKLGDLEKPLKDAGVNVRGHGSRAPHRPSDGPVCVLAALQGSSGKWRENLRIHADDDA